MSSQSWIFKDKDRLSPRYIPTTLPHREEQIRLLHNFFKDTLSKPVPLSPRIVQIIGSVGSGKTATTIRFGERFQKDGKRFKREIMHVYVNLKLHGGSRVVLYRHIVQQAAPEIYSASLSGEELLLQLVKHLKIQDRLILITLDEIDYFLKHTKDTHVIYDLTRLNEITHPGEPCGVIGIVFTARSRDFQKKLDEAELSTLGRFAIKFTPYLSHQILDILQQRVAEAFQKGAVSTEILEYVADVTANPSIHSDIRYALDLLLFAGNLAEYEGRGSITIEDVRSILNETNPSITSEDILSLPLGGRIVLLAVAKALQVKRSPYVSLRDIRSNSSFVCEQFGLSPLSVDDVEEGVGDLNDRGIIDVKSLSAIGISGVPTEALDRFLRGLLAKVGTSIHEG